MAAVGFVDDVHHSGRFDVSAIDGRSTILVFHRCTSFAPDVSLENIVVIGKANRWRVLHRLAE